MTLTVDDVTKLLEKALSELSSVQMIDNTWREALNARDEVIQILTDPVCGRSGRGGGMREILLWTLRPTLWDACNAIMREITINEGERVVIERRDNAWSVTLEGLHPIPYTAAEESEE